MSYVGSVVRSCSLLFPVTAPTTCTLSVSRPFPLLLTLLMQSYSASQGLANNTAGRRLLVVIDTITLYYVLANVPANESAALSSMLETSASQAQFKALLISEGER